ncbi:MAG: CpXC domain-containing protein [Chloroflexota bacterium]
MQTQITCPNCGTPYTADIYQVIDARRQPQLKEMLLSGQLNYAVCPNCGAGGRIATPLLYHDPDHDLFMVHVPQEMNMDQVQREELIGRLVNQVVDMTPAEERRGYMLQPQTILTMQSFLEKVLETEGITPEMIARQQKQVEMINTLSTASPDVVDYLLKERAGEIDETVFAILRAQIEALSQSGDSNQVVPLLNLQAKLMTATEVGRELEKRQMAIHALNRDVKKEQGLTPDLLLKHLIANKDDATVVNTIALAGQAAMTYDFFTKLTAEIDKLEKAKKTDEARQLSDMRDQLLKLQQDLRAASEEMLKSAQQVLDNILAANDTEAAIMQNAGQIDEAFMHVLSARMAHAQQTGNQDQIAKLQRVEQFIVSMAQTDMPPELDLLNELASAPTADDRARIMETNKDMLSDDLLELIEAIKGQAESSNQMDLVERLNLIGNELEARLSAS